MKFALGYGFDPSDVEEFTRVARCAEESGLAMVTTGDTPALLGDVYIGLTLIAQHTSRCRVGTLITNPVTRHPAVTASAISSIQALSGGRAVLGISSGDSGTYNVGAKPASVRQLEEYVTTLHGLWDHGEAQYRGTTVRFTWSQGRVPVFLAPGGPRGLHLAGRIADGVVIETGFLPEVIEDSLARVEAGAKEVGRSLDDIEIWWHARSAFGESKDEATYRLRSGLAGIANRFLRFGAEGKMVPDELLPKFEELKARYSIISHHEEHGGAMRNAELLEELGLLDYVAERFGLLGTPRDWIDKLERLRPYGMENVAFAGLMPDKVAFLKTVAEEIMPVLGDGAAATRGA